jgi:uncharacterized membrane protein
MDPLYRAMPFDVDKSTAIVLIKLCIGVLVFGFIWLIGLGTELFFIRSIFRLGEKILDRVPMVNRIYSTFRDVMQAFMGSQRELFRSAVLIEYPRKGIHSVGFITKSSHPELSKMVNKDLTSVFVPTTPNPTSGVLLFVPKDEMIPLPLTVEEAIKLVISAGALTGKQAQIPRK